MIKELDREEIQKYRQSKEKPRVERKHYSELVESNPFTRLAVEETKRKANNKQETVNNTSSEDPSTIESPHLPNMLKPEEEIDAYKEAFKNIRLALNSLKL